MKYQIVRFYQDGRPNRVLRKNLTLEEAKTHCNRSDTRGVGWFDGWQQQP